MADAPLIPVIVQDASSGRVLMLAYANDEAIARTRESGEAWFWSRSRAELWHKGATSGNTLAVEEIRDDCDGDALLYRVRPSGPACHTGAESCFAPWLWRVIAERAATRPDGSYVAGLLAGGPAAAARKVGEEAVEAALAAVTESDERLVEELADLWFHSYVLLAARGLQPSAVEDELHRRHATRASLSQTPAPCRTRVAPRAGATIVASMTVAAGISTDELRERRERLRALVADRHPTGYVVFDQSYVQYLTRFSFLATERPVAYVESATGETAAFVPEFEVARVEAETAFDRVASYPEYPGEEHPMLILARVLAEMGIHGTIAADQDGYPGILGYEGPSLSAVTGASVVSLAQPLERLMARKSEAELELIRESGRWCEHAHRLLQEYTRPGVTEAQAGLRAGYEASLAMLDALGRDYDGQLSSTDGASAGYRGQIGERSAWAHAIAHNIEFSIGDVLVTETSAPVWGYNAELERAMIVGPPTDEMRRHFDHMCAAQQVAFDALRPGVTCAAVDRAVLSYFEEQGIIETWSQHTGHAIGLRNHEAPFLDVGDETVIEPGMVFTIEPGVYVAGLGGFRHSDTVAVTPDGIELLTDYPSDIESLTLPA